MNTSYYCVILAGGIGSRFWPYSRKSKPKQFLDFFGTGESLLQMTYRRFSADFAPDHIFISTNIRYKEIVQEQLPKLPGKNILGEPCARNTASAIAYATMHICSLDPNATIVFAPSDHLVLKEQQFSKCIRHAMTHAEKSTDITTLGIHPTHPETGYGYIQIDIESEELDDIDKSKFYPVKTFTEKPNRQMAKILVESGEFFWNSGLFFANIKVLKEAFTKHLPEIAERLMTQTSDYGTDREEEFITEVFPYCPNISFDYGIMEKAERVSMLLCDSGWADLGYWGAIYQLSAKDNDENAILAKHAITNDSCGNLIVTENDQTLVALQGINDTIIVQKDNVILLCHKGEEQKLKQILLTLTENGGAYLD